MDLWEEKDKTTAKRQEEASVLHTAQKKWSSISLELIFLQSMIDVKEWFRQTSCTCQAGHVFSVNTHSQAKKQTLVCSSVSCALRSYQI